MSNTDNSVAPRSNRTIRLPFYEEQYPDIMEDAKLFRSSLDDMFKTFPALFPQGFENGYEIKEKRYSKRMNMSTRRILIDKISYTIQPSFVMPYMTGMVKDVEKGLYLRKYCVPYHAIAYCFGRNSMYWYRMASGLGRFSIVGATIQTPSLLPPHILNDEKHTWLNGEKVYCATTVASGCVLGASIVGGAGQKDLEKAYGVFKDEAQAINPDYRPKTANTDGWSATQLALKALFPGITLILCFLHVFIGIRDRCSKRYKDVFSEVSEKLWNCYHAEKKSSFSQRVRRLDEWAKKILFLKLSGINLINYEKTFLHILKPMISREHSEQAT